MKSIGGRDEPARGASKRGPGAVENARFLAEYMPFGQSLDSDVIVFRSRKSSERLRIPTISDAIWWFPSGYWILANGSIFVPHLASTRS